MATEKQLEANRANATRSTGPRSAQGKVRSSMNACKHGLTAQTIVIDDEDPQEFARLRRALEEQYEPHSLIERELVERLAGIIWRLRRIPAFEVTLIEARRSEVGFINHRKELMGEIAAELVAAGLHGDQSIDVIASAVEKKLKRREEFAANTGLALIRDSQCQDALGKLSRHEAALMNAFTKTLQMLHFPTEPTARGG